jgi:hypothetical protein
MNASPSEETQVEPPRYCEELAASGTAEIAEADPGDQPDQAAKEDSGVRNWQFDFATKAPAKKHGAKGK